MLFQMKLRTPTLETSGVFGLDLVALTGLVGLATSFFGGAFTSMEFA